ncbi:MAG: SUMF1/EgtB/PvdO family nonheme iron enzyme [Bryobacterales bacterium]|nr:SUMF1/EgtB/PvdO family nonheme iron enzyme [Bryobacterales bacterium]
MRLAEWGIARRASDHLFAVLTDGTLYHRAVDERHRFIFYLGHLEAFDWNLLGAGHLRMRSPRPEWDSLFAFGIDPGADALPSDLPEDWPAEAAVRGYVDSVREALDARVAALPAQLLQVAVEHRWMHVETLSYLVHNLEYERKRGADEEYSTSGVTPENPIIEVPPGRATLGQRQGEFGWDNEFPCHAVAVDGFAMQQHKVTNGEYLRFVEAGGPIPHFWRHSDAGWKLRRMFSEVALPLDWPVYVTHQQACAYAAWAGLRLPSEAEFHRAAYCDFSDGERNYPWGDESPNPGHGNFGLRGWNPTRVDAHPAGISAFGFWQMVGNGWEWTGTAFAPFHGFQAFPFYRGYSADFFDNQHYVLKGGSPRTAPPLLRRSFRNWFRPEYRYAFATFRCVADAGIRR